MLRTENVAKNFFVKTTPVLKHNLTVSLNGQKLNFYPNIKGNQRTFTKLGTNNNCRNVNAAATSNKALLHGSADSELKTFLASL